MKNYPMLAARANTPFAKDLQSPPMVVNGNPMSRGIWNMIISKRDLTMWVKCKMKPNRGWKVSDVKNYFGLKGNGQKLLEQFLALKEECDRFMEETK